MDRLIIDRPVIVEGKYDKIKLSSVIEANIITTDGFGIFRETEKRSLIRRLAEKKGIIILCDSDGAGALIRSHIKSFLPPEKIIDLYTPCMRGKEKRKKEPSKSGLLGVEGMEAQLLYRLFEPFAADASCRGEPPDPITRGDFYEDGLSGSADSAKKRAELAKKLGFPQDMSCKSLIAAINLLYTKDQYKELIKK